MGLIGNGINWLGHEAMQGGRWLGGELGGLFGSQMPQDGQGGQPDPNGGQGVPQTVPQAQRQVPQTQDPYAGLPKPSPWRVLDDVLGGHKTISQAMDYERFRPLQQAYALHQMRNNAAIADSITGDLTGQGGQPSQYVPGAPQPGVPQSMPQQGQGGPQTGAPGIPGVPQPAGIQRALAASAFMNGHADQAASILQKDVVQLDDGTLLDKRTGQVVGRSAMRPDMKDYNGVLLNSHDPDIAGAQIPKSPFDGAVAQWGPLGVKAGPIGYTLPGDKSGRVYSPDDLVAMAEGKKSLATETAKAGLDLVDVPIGGGRTMKMTRAKAAAVFGGQGGQGGGPGVPGVPGGGAIGVTPSTADTAYDSASAADLVKQQSADMDRRENALQNYATAQGQLTFIRSHQMNPATHIYAEAADYARTLPPQVLQAAHIDPNRVNELANSTDTFDRLATAGRLQGAKTLLPSRYTERELALLGKIFPSITTPNEAAALFYAQQGALANREREQADFAAGYQGQKSRAAYGQAWQQGPGSKSIFQDPIWNGIAIHGKPAVQYATKNGVQYGAFMPFLPDGKPNPNAVVFKVR